AAEGGGAQPQCRPPDDAFAVRQDEQGPRQLQHAALCREGHAAVEGRLLRMGRPLVAAAYGPRRARRPRLVPTRGLRGGVTVAERRRPAGIQETPSPPPGERVGVRGRIPTQAPPALTRPPLPRRPPSPAVRERGLQRRGCVWLNLRPLPSS